MHDQYKGSKIWICQIGCQFIKGLSVMGEIVHKGAHVGTLILNIDR